jgi:hypothetical protein
MDNPFIPDQGGKNMKKMKTTICLLTLCALLAAGLAAAVGGPGRTGHFLVRSVSAVMAQTAKKDAAKKGTVKKDEKKKTVKVQAIKSKADLTALSKKFTVTDHIAIAGSNIAEDVLKDKLTKEINDQLIQKLKDLVNLSFDTNFLTGTITSFYTVKGFLKDMMGFSGLPGVSQDAMDFSNGFFGHGLTGFSEYELNPNHMGNQSFYMSGGGGGEWYGSVSFYDYSGQSGSSSVTSITMSEYYVNSSDGSTMTVETHHENGVTTQTVTYTDSKGNVTTETSTDGDSSGSGSSGSDSSGSGSSGSGSGGSDSENPPPKEGEEGMPNPEDDTPGGAYHPVHPIVAACFSKMTASQMGKMHDSIWLKIKKGTTVDPSPIDTEGEMKGVILNARKVSGLGNNPVIDYSPEKIRTAIVEKKLKIDPKKIIDPKPAK